MGGEELRCREKKGNGVANKVPNGVEAAKKDLAHIFSSFQIISYSKKHLCPLQLLSYALEISLSIMEL